jgi:hypothetical protein
MPIHVPSGHLPQLWQYINYTIYFLLFVRPPAIFKDENFAAACAWHLQGPGVAALCQSRHHIDIPEDVQASNSISIAHIVLKILQLQVRSTCKLAWVHVGWPGAGAALQPAVASVVAGAWMAGAEEDCTVADVGARAPQLAVEAAVPSHQWRLQVLASLHPACMWQITAQLELQHVSNANRL